MWLSRVQELIFEVGPHVVVQADDRWGLPYVLASMRASGHNVLHIDLDSADTENPIALGNRLSDAVFSATGVRLFGLGMPFSYGLSILESNREYLSPAVTVLRHPEYGKHLRQGVVALASARFRILELYSDDVTPEEPSNVTLTGLDFAVRAEEAADMFAGHLNDEDLERLLQDTDGAYSDLLTAGNRYMSLPPPTKPSIGLYDTQVDVSGNSPAVIDYLVRDRRWIEAFELALGSARYDKAVSIINHAGEAYFEAGLFTQFWQQLRAFPDDVFADDMPAYWLLSAAIAVDKREEVRELLSRQLGIRPMPNLRALMACSGSTVGSLKEAEAAFEHEKTPMTVRALSYCLASSGRPNEALRVALDHLPDIEQFATPRELASYSNTIGRILLFLGRYAAALEWVNWGLKIYEEARLKEELLRLALLSAKAYYALLLGKRDIARGAMASVSLDVTLAGIPSLDAIFSTAGDIALVNQEYERALELYSVNARESGREQIGYYAVDQVCAMIMCEMVDEALATAKECHVLATGTPERNAAFTRLALGIANSYKGVHEAEDQLLSSMKYFRNSNDSVSLSRAALHLAQHYRARGQADRAAQVLLDSREHIRDLGESGWLLLGLPTAKTRELWDEFHSNSDIHRFKFLGRRVHSVGGNSEPLSLRNAEILALLSSQRNGVTGEQLLYDLYGEDGSIGTVKASISKLRQLVPIASRPYRIDARLEADHVVIQRLLEQGRTAEALELYHGPLLPLSDAPGIVRLREILAESLRQSVLASGDRSLMLRYLDLVSDDLEVVESLMATLAPDDPHFSSVAARHLHLRREWGLD